jgi:uncharacterized protein (DUF1778 family)
MAQAAKRTQRIELRISPYALKVVRRAAEIEGCSISDFVAGAAQEIAEHTIERTRIIRDSMAAHERVMKALSKPQKIAPALERRSASHRKVIRSMDTSPSSA